MKPFKSPTGARGAYFAVCSLKTLKTAETLCRAEQPVRYAIMYREVFDTAE